jgi:hypothetical protein
MMKTLTKVKPIVPGRGSGKPAPLLDFQLLVTLC